MKKPQHALRSHSDLPPSSADKWLACYGWRATVAQHRELFGTPPSSAAAEEGTRAHEKMERHLLTFDNVSSPHISQGFELTEDDDEYFDLLPMLEWVQEQPGELYVESRVDFGEGFGYVGLTGTVDIQLVEPHRITIVDLKYGRQKVEVVDEHGRPNKQLMTYLVGVVNKFGPRLRYRLVILQPRSWHKDGPIREVEVSHAALKVFEFELEEAVDANYRGSEATPGPHCRNFCLALSSCRAVANAARQLMRDTPLEE